MRLDRILSERWRGLTQEIAKFGTIGVINVFVNFGVLNLLLATFMRGSEVKAKAVATTVAITSAYFMNRHWTYRDRPKSTLQREYSLFFFFNLVGLVIEVVFVGVAKYGFHQTHILIINICSGLGIAAGTIFRFWAYRTHVFRAAPVLSPTAPTAAGTAGAVAPATAPRRTLRGPAGAATVNAPAAKSAPSPNGAAGANGAAPLRGGARKAAARRNARNEPEPDAGPRPFRRFRRLAISRPTFTSTALNEGAER